MWGTVVGLLLVIIFTTVTSVLILKSRQSTKDIMSTERSFVPMTKTGASAMRKSGAVVLTRCEADPRLGKITLVHDGPAETVLITIDGHPVAQHRTTGPYEMTVTFPVRGILYTKKTTVVDVGSMALRVARASKYYKEVVKPGPFENTFSFTFLPTKERADAAAEEKDARFRAHNHDNALKWVSDDLCTPFRCDMECRRLPSFGHVYVAVRGGPQSLRPWNHVSVQENTRRTQIDRKKNGSRLITVPIQGGSKGIVNVVDDAGWIVASQASDDGPQTIPQFENMKPVCEVVYDLERREVVVNVSAPSGCAVVLRTHALDLQHTDDTGKATFTVGLEALVIQSNTMALAPLSVDGWTVAVLGSLFSVSIQVPWPIEVLLVSQTSEEMFLKIEDRRQKKNNARPDTVCVRGAPPVGEDRRGLGDRVFRPPPSLGPALFRRHPSRVLRRGRCGMARHAGQGFVA